MDETAFRIVIATMLAIAFSISGHFRRKAERAAGERISRRADGGPMMLLLAVSGLSAWGSVLIYVINPQWMAWAALPLPIALRWLGVAISAATLPLFYWLFSSIGQNITPTSATRKRHTLVTHGPYRRVRHPLYSVGAAFFLGLCLMTANGFTALAIALGGLALAIRTPIEEAQLIEKFGDAYRAYMRRTGRFLPRLK